jgi:hypothetical protein
MNADAGRPEFRIFSPGLRLQNQTLIAEEAKGRMQMTEQVGSKKSKAEKVTRALWLFTKVVLCVGVYLGLHGLLIHLMVAGVAGGVFGVGYAVTMSVFITAAIHFYGFLIQV